MEYFSINGQLSQNFNLIPQPNTSSKIVYEVVRVINGKLLFWEEHLARLKNSLTVEQVECKEQLIMLEAKVHKTIKANNMLFGNILIQIISEKQIDLLIKKNPHHYPSPEDYRNGVSVGTLNAERINPGAKVVQQDLRNRANQMIRDEHIYEVLLIDEDETVTEGSRSNVCFIKGDALYIPPMVKVLRGITLEKILKIAHELKFEIVESAIQTSALKDFDAAFISGTSPKILSLKKLNAFTYDVNNQKLRMLMKYFDKMMLKSLKK